MTESATPPWQGTQATAASLMTAPGHSVSFLMRENRGNLVFSLRACEIHKGVQGEWMVVSESFLSTTVLTLSNAFQKRAYSEMGAETLVALWL